MRAFTLSIGAFVLAASGSFALTQCSSSSNDASTFAGGNSADAAIDIDCATAVAFTCPQAVPNVDTSCNPPNPCTSTESSQTACPYLCANGQQQFVASCPNGKWAVITVNDCNANFDAGPDADANDAGDGG